MSRARGNRFDRFLDSGGPWRNPFPPKLRLAAELYFGTFIVAAVITGVKYGFGGGAALLAASALLSAVTHFRGATSPVTWWGTVVLGTLIGLFMCVVALVAE